MFDISDQDPYPIKWDRLVMPKIRASGNRTVGTD